MKRLFIHSGTVCITLLLAGLGCEPQPPVAESGAGQVRQQCGHADYAGYLPVRVNFLPLTEVKRPADANTQPHIVAYVALLDAFNCSGKAPGVFRFELYEYTPRAAQPKGARVHIWGDYDLTDPAQNNKFWQDFVRAYKFTLDYQPQADKRYILQVTCMCPQGRRLMAEVKLRG